MSARWSLPLLFTLAFGTSPAHTGDGSPEGDPGRRRPTLTIEGDRFLLDGRPFAMWGIRTASGTQDDAQCDHLVAQLDDYKAHGVNRWCPTLTERPAG